MTRLRHRLLAAALVAALPSLAIAQRGAGPQARPAVPGGAGASALIEMRQQLDLTPRQVAALDSIERAQQQRTRAARQRLVLRRDSLLAGRNPRTLTPDERAAMHARLDSLRPLRDQLRRGDSTARLAAFRVLTDSQRVRARVLMAERRGFAMGRRAARAGGAGPMGPRGAPMARRMQARRGMMQGPPGIRRGPGGGMGMGPQGPGGAMAPGMRMRMGARAGQMGPPPAAGPPMQPPAPGARMRMRARMGPGAMNMAPPADSTKPAGPPPRRPPTGDR